MYMQFRVILENGVSTFATYAFICLLRHLSHSMSMKSNQTIPYEWRLLLHYVITVNLVPWNDKSRHKAPINNLILRYFVMETYWTIFNIYSIILYEFSNWRTITLPLKLNNLKRLISFHHSFLVYVNIKKWSQQCSLLLFDCAVQRASATATSIWYCLYIYHLSLTRNKRRTHTECINQGERMKLRNE